MALAYEHHPDPEMRPYKEPMSIERREQLIVGVAASVPAIYRYFSGDRKWEIQKLSSVRTFRRKLAATSHVHADQARSSSTAVPT
jgi:uncharacterized protein